VYYYFLTTKNGGGFEMTGIWHITLGVGYFNRGVIDFYYITFEEAYYRKLVAN
jgi:hypothetical protein